MAETVYVQSTPYTLTDEEKTETMDSIHNKRVDLVSVDGSVLLQIIKHASIQPTVPVFGTLAGFAEKDYVDVTYSFPTPAEQYLGSDPNKYQTMYMQYLTTNGYCADVVGIYITTTLSDFLNDQTLAEIIFRKAQSEKFVLITYDPIQASQVCVNLSFIRTPFLFPIFFVFLLTSRASLHSKRSNFHGNSWHLPIVNPTMISLLLFRFNHCTFFQYKSS